MPATARKQERLDRTLLALADPTRRELLERVGGGPRRATDLSRGLPKDAGLVTAVPQGREVLYQRAEELAALEEARAFFERMSADWDRALAAFKRFAEAGEKRS